MKRRFSVFMRTLFTLLLPRYLHPSSTTCTQEADQGADEILATNELTTEAQQ
ncbi:hypothetical protein E2C01_049671 [Portunus trituberculatus]|uniref:Uncharacterized protein n=1 Tax=Portunus trituberculatus TaxID=210409 RepID=A0A5B7GEG9_PORTR|nr:hypothetical protein [Portunus trituberculatus]